MGRSGASPALVCLVNDPGSGELTSRVSGMLSLGALPLGNRDTQVSSRLSGGQRRCQRRWRALERNMLQQTILLAGREGGRGGQRVRASDALSKCDAVGCHFTERSPLSSARSVLSRNNHGAQALSPLLACASSFNFGLLWARS